MLGPGPLILDGGLATTIEASGVALHPKQWSAGTVVERPDAVRDAHERFLDAGAEVLITASYQMPAGPGMARTVEIARDACRRAGVGARVAGSLGPYGAFLADGSEYVGRYAVGPRELAEFHRPRLRALAAASPDWLAFETIPSLAEVRALCDELDALDLADAWISFSCRDGGHLADGTPVGRAAALAQGARRVAAVGVNCVAPADVAPLIEAIRRCSTKPVVVYPNSGESWDGVKRRWRGTAVVERFVDLAEEWAALGARAVGGCCRVGPETIAALSRRLRGT